jgi:hypothetical protein
MTKLKRRKLRKVPAPAPLSGPSPERITRRRTTRSSVEAALPDWPEDALDPERWFLERPAPDEQRD